MPLCVGGAGCAVCVRVIDRRIEKRGLFYTNFEKCTKMENCFTFGPMGGVNRLWAHGNGIAVLQNDTHL